jgi:hypothetical protein
MDFGSRRTVLQQERKDGHYRSFVRLGPRIRRRIGGGLSVTVGTTQAKLAATQLQCLRETDHLCG